MKELIHAKVKGGKAIEKKFNEKQKIAEEEERKDKAKNIKIKKQKNFKSFRKLLRQDICHMMFKINGWKPVG